MSRFTDLLIDARNGAQPDATARMIAALTPASIAPRDHVTWLSLVVDRWVRTMAAEGIDCPLAQPITAACLIDDLFGLAEAPTPASVAELVGART